MSSIRVTSIMHHWIKLPLNQRLRSWEWKQAGCWEVPTSLGHRKWFYLYDPTGSLPAYSADRLGEVAFLSWKGCLTDERLKLAERLLEQITSLKNAGLTGQAVVCTSLLHCVLRLKVRAFPMWDYIRARDSSMEEDESLPTEALD